MITKTPPEVLTTQKKLFMSTLNEYQKRQYLGTEALALGKRGVDKVSQFFGVSKNTVYSSIDEINSSYVSVSGVTYCNINHESYLSNFRGQCYLFTLLFLCPLVRKEIPVGFDWSPVRHFSHPVEQVGKIFKEVDAMQPAGTCQ